MGFTMPSQQAKGKRLIYRSQSRNTFSAAGLGALNHLSRYKNAQLDLTGLLLYHHGHFFGVLEGHPDTVDQSFARISKDTRHENVRLVRQAEIETRAFGFWRLGVTDPDHVPSRLRTGMFGILDLLPPDTPLRGDAPDVRADVRRFLAGFATLAETPLRVAS